MNDKMIRLIENDITSLGANNQKRNIEKGAINCENNLVNGESYAIMLLT